MERRMKMILILLACLCTIAPAIGAQIDLGGGSSNMISSPGGVVSGGDFMTTDVNTSDELGFSAGVRAHAELPEGATGYAFSHWTKTNNTSMSLTTSGGGGNFTASNGNGYVLTVGYGGTVSADVIKTSPMGRAISDAQISARAHANKATNMIDGMALINASTSNTGIGQTRALASGNASYSVMQITNSNSTGSSDNSSEAKGNSVFGNVSGVIDLHSVNLDSGVSLNDSGMYTGTPQGMVSGSAYIRSISESDNVTSKSNATMAVDHLTAMRLGMDGVSHIGATVNGVALAGTSKGGTTIATNNTGGNNTGGNNTGGNNTGGNNTGGNNTGGNNTSGNSTGSLNLSMLVTGNESTVAMAKGMLGGMANAYAPGDMAAASSMLRSDAMATGGTTGSNSSNMTGGGGFINATGVANTSTSIVRTNASLPSTAASAESMIVNAKVNAIAKNFTRTTTSGNGTGGGGNGTGGSSGGVSPVAGGGSGSGTGGIGGGSGAGGGVQALIGNGTGNGITQMASMANVNASKINMRSAISAMSAWSGNNSATKTIMASDDSASGPSASISDVIVNKGPSMNSSAADFSLASENLTGLSARATNGTSVAGANITDLNLLSFISGNTSTPGGLAVLGPISAPTFDNSTGSQGNVTGPVATPGNETGSNSITITYNVTAGPMVPGSSNNTTLMGSNASPLSF